MGGGLYFMIYSGFAPFRYFGHAINVLKGKYDNPNDPGEITHFQALSSALAATVGMGNISGVAVAIMMGGPGALFWMWVSAFVGMATKFFTCTLAVMYRGKDSEGQVQGGPMYVITEGLGKKWRPLAVFFCIAALFGPLPIFQANQLTQVIRDVVAVPNGWVGEDPFWFNLGMGLFLAAMVSVVILGGIKRISNVASKMVPTMVIIYVLAVLYIIIANIEQVPSSFALIFSDAFSADAVLGGAVGALIIIGAKRASFSNEAGIGTAPMMHGAAKTKEPIREGLVAMMGPAIDTLLVCTMTALAILITGVWETGSQNGVTLTVQAFEQGMPGIGKYVLVLCVVFFATSSLFTFSYYGTKALSYMTTVKFSQYYNYFYILTIVLGSVVTIQMVISLIDGMYALMAIPTMTSAILLSPKVKAAATDYFRRMKEEKIR